jgi:hypothetical protein
MVLWLRRHALVALALAVAAVAAGACADLFGPSRDARPELAGFDLSAVSVLPRGIVLTIVGHPADTSFRLRYGQRVHVEIAVSNGDRESADLYRSWCPVRERGARFHCFQFSVYTGDSLPVWDLGPGLASVGARLFDLGACSASGCWSDPHIGEVIVFSPDGLIPVAKLTAATPGVLFVELDGPYACVDLCPPLPEWDLEQPLLVDSGTVVPHDGTVQMRSGDTVVVSYAQPSGGTLTGRWVAP